MSEELRLQLSQHDNLKNIIYISTEVEKIIFEIELNYVYPLGQSCKISADFILGLLSPQGHGLEIASTFYFFYLPSTLSSSGIN